MATIQMGGTKSKMAHRLSTATRIRADNACIGGPSDAGCELIRAGSGGRTSNGTTLGCTSLMRGGVSTKGTWHSSAPDATAKAEEVCSRFGHESGGIHRTSNASRVSERLCWGSGVSKRPRLWFSASLRRDALQRRRPRRRALVAGVELLRHVPKSEA